MDKEKNSYEILGIKSEIINWILNQKDNGEFKLERRKPEQIDEIIKHLYDSKMKILQYGIDNNKSPYKIEEIKENMEKLTTAYETIKSGPLREIYNEELEKIKRKKERPLIDETAYDFFGISEKNIKMYPVNKSNSLVESAYNKIIEKCNKALQNEETDFRQRQKIEYILKKSESYYNLINTPEKRKIYEEILDRKEKEINEKARREYIKVKYSKKNYYNKDLIKTTQSGEKMVARKEIKRAPYVLLEDESNTFIKKKAEIIFKNCTGGLESNINEYEVIKTIKGQEKRDIIYTNLLLSELGIDNETGKPVNPKYYDCVVNKLLTEDMIEGSKYNGGYIGLIEKKENGEYHTTLGKEELDPTEQEMLTAVMIIKEREKNTQEREEGR